MGLRVDLLLHMGPHLAFFYTWALTVFSMIELIILFALANYGPWEIMRLSFYGSTDAFEHPCLIMRLSFCGSTDALEHPDLIYATNNAPFHFAEVRMHLNIPV